MLQPDYKIFEMNKRLQQRTEDSDNLWWDAFANEFFEDEAQLTLTFCLEDGPKRYSKFLLVLSLVITHGYFSCGKDIDPPLLPKYLRGRSDGPSLGAETLQGIIPSSCCLLGLWPSNHGHPTWQANVHQGKGLLQEQLHDYSQPQTVVES